MAAISPFITAITICVSFIAAVFFAWYFSHQARAKERRLLIEKAFEKDLDLNTLPKELLEVSRSQFSWLKAGIVVTGASLGFIFGLGLNDLGFRWGVPPFWMFLLAGISMIIAHYVDKPGDDEQA